MLSWWEQNARKPQVVTREETLLVRNTGGEEMVDKRLAENQPSTAATAPWSHLGAHPWERTLLHVTRGHNFFFCSTASLLVGLQ